MSIFDELSESISDADITSSPIENTLDPEKSPNSDLYGSFQVPEREEVMPTSGIKDVSPIQALKYPYKESRTSRRTNHRYPYSYKMWLELVAKDLGLPEAELARRCTLIVARLAIDHLSDEARALMWNAEEFRFLTDEEFKERNGDEL